MDGKFDSRHPLVGLVDEISRLNGRLKTTFAASRRAIGLGESEMMVLNAVVEAERPPTVPQIGRSLGSPRQLVQRATNALVARGLIETAANPDHKRAGLLVPTARGIAMKREADAAAEALGAGLSAAVDAETAHEATRLLRTIRRALEERLRAGG
ncbi:MAG: MarR family transcriptional regulator [Sphingomonadales bacterium]|nr:MarR family transcriptional regulator [Sphingomonadales bacterium]